MKICNQCHATNPDDARFCSKCGAPLAASRPWESQSQQQYQPNQQYQQYQQPYQPQQPNMSKPDNNMVWAILTTLLCCLPLGIVSIVNAAKVNGLYQNGDYNGAVDAANNAKNYAIYSAICGVVASVIYIIIIFIGSM